jgi:hypothetical protein
MMTFMLKYRNSERKLNLGFHTSARAKYICEIKSIIMKTE